MHHFIFLITEASKETIVQNAIPDRIIGNPTSSDAFILPQWGGIILLNGPSGHLTTASLERVFHIFHRQLLALLGVPALPPNVRSSQLEPFTDWQLDALIRQRARQNFENSDETLNSIVKLVHQIENMPVGQDVKGDVQDALNALDAVRTLPVFPPGSILTGSSFAYSRLWKLPPCHLRRPCNTRAKLSRSPRVHSSTRACSPYSTSRRSTNMRCTPHCSHLSQLHSLLLSCAS